MVAHDENTKKYKILNLGILLLGSILFIVVYTFVLQRNYSYNTLKTEVENDVSRSDAIYETICNNLTKEDYTEINDVSDMDTERYQALQKRLNEVRRMKSARYLYTANRAEDGSLVYLVDGLDLGAEDFAYPGTLIEEEVLPYLEAAINGETTYSQKIMDTTWGIFSRPVIRFMIRMVPEILLVHFVLKWIWKKLIKQSRRTTIRLERLPWWLRRWQFF